MSQPPGTWSQPGYALVYEQVQRRAGLLSPSCFPAAEEGIDRALQRSGCEGISAYAERLATDASAFDDLLTELTIGETYFFRTHEHFDCLEVDARPRPGPHPLQHDPPQHPVQRLQRRRRHLAPGPAEHGADRLGQRPVQ